MPFERPTPEALRDRLAAEIAAALGVTGTAPRRSAEAMLVRMLALATHGLHGHLDWLARQVLVDTADDELLDRHASIWGLARLAPAAAVGSATLRGTAGVVLPAGIELIRADGATYRTTAPALLGAGPTGVPTVAATPGALANAPLPVAITPVSPVAGLAPAGTLTATGGADRETDASLRDRVLARIRRPPQGGAVHDYLAWARAVPGVTRAWVRPLARGAGTVDVLVMRDGDADPYPTGPALAAIQATIDKVRPVTAFVVVAPPVPMLVPVTIALSPDTVAVRAAVLGELGAFFAREAAPGQVLPLSRIGEAISAAAGEVSHRLLAPATAPMPAARELPVLGAVSFA